MDMEEFISNESEPKDGIEQELEETIDMLEKDNAFESEISQKQDSVIESIRQEQKKETEARVCNIPYSVNASDLVTFIERQLKIGSVVRVELLVRNKRRTGTAIVLFRDKALYDCFKSKEGTLSLLGRTLRVSEGTGNSKHRRKNDYQIVSFQMHRYQLGLPYSPDDGEPFYALSEYTKNPTFEINPANAVLSIKFSLNTAVYRADYYIRHVRAVALEIDSETSHLVLSFCSRECPRIYRPENQSGSSSNSDSQALHGLNDAFSFSSIAGLLEGMLTKNLWELGVDEGAEGKWIRTTDPTAESVLSNSLQNRLFLQMHENDDKFHQLLALLQDFCISPSRISSGEHQQLSSPEVIELSPCRPVSPISLTHKRAIGDGSFVFFTHCESKVFLALQALDLPFSVAYWLHCLVGAHKIDLIHEFEHNEE